MKLFLQNKKNVCIALTGVFTVVLYAIHGFVFLNNGDDFMFAAFGKSGALSNAINYYFTGNGRLWINTINAIILKYDRLLYCVVNPLIVLIHVFLMAKNIKLLTRNDNIGFEEIYISTLIIVSCHNILCLQEAVFWICGSVNYLLPSTLFLAGLYLFQLSAIEGLGNKERILYIVLSLFIASSVEQFALIYVGIHILSCMANIKKKTMVKYDFIVLAISIISLLFLLLAPGNYVRVNNANAFENTSKIIENIWTILYQNSFSDASFPFMLMLSLALGCASKEYFKSNRVIQLFRVYPFILVAVKVIPVLQKAVILFPLIILYLVFLFVAWLQEKSIENRGLLLSLSLCMIGAQAMLVVTALWGYRYMFCTYVIQTIIILYLMSKTGSMDRSFLLLIGISAAYMVELCLLFIILCTIVGLLKKEYRFFKYTVCAITLCFCILHGIEIINGYRTNAVVIKENILATQEYTEGVLTLEKLPIENYSWCYLPVSSEWFQKYYKEYYNLPMATEIVCIDTGSRLQ